MVNIEAQVFTQVKTALGGAVTVKSIEDYSPTAFPTVCIYEADNYSLKRTTSTSSMENHVNVMYTVSVYTNGNEKKKNARTLLTTVDTTMTGMGFRRQTMTVVPDNDYYRLTARYVATVGVDETIYRR